MRWFHLSRALPAGRGQSTTVSWLLCSFSKIMQINRRTGGGGWLEWGLGRGFSSMEWTGQGFCCKYPRQYMALHRMQKNIRNLARHVATLPAHRWVQRLLSWRPFGARRAGRPRHTWESKLEAYCGHTNMGSWREAALDEIVWNWYLNSLIDFCRM